MSQRVAFFTSTMGGAGHIARALAIGAGLRRRGFTGEYRIFGPEVPYASARVEHYVTSRLSREEQRDEALAQRSDLARAMVEFDPDLVLVDMFWLPIRGILKVLRAEAWLLLNTVPRTWLRGPPRVRFEPKQYARVLAIEPMRYLDRLEQVEPIVICNPDECKPPGALKARLGVPADQRLTLVVQTGFGGEVEELLETYRRQGEAVVSMSMHRDEAIFPLAPWLRDADRLVGGGGYNFFWETTWLGLRERTLYHPFFRTIDHQSWRVEHSDDYVMRQNGADVLADMAMGRRRTPFADP